MTLVYFLRRLRVIVGVSLYISMPNMNSINISKHPLSWLMEEQVGLRMDVAYSLVPLYLYVNGEQCLYHQMSVQNIDMQMLLNIII